MKTLLIRSLLALALGATLVGVAYAATFVEPTSAPPNGNQLGPLTLGSGLQQKSGNFGATTITSTSGYTIPGSGSVSWNWDVESNFATLNIQQLCLGSTCVQALGAGQITGQGFQVGDTSCGSGSVVGWCAADPYTAAEFCAEHGYSHVSITASGGGSAGSGSQPYVMTYNPTTDGTGVGGGTQSNSGWVAGSGCHSSCSGHTLTYIACDDDGTSPTSAPTISANNG